MTPPLTTAERTTRRSRPQDDRAGRTPTSFDEIGLPEDLARILTRQGITSPRPIQAAALPPALDGRDVCGRAPTGSGKTLAFALPLAEIECNRDGRPAALVLTPTRELASQIAEVLEPFAKARRLRVATMFGGTKINADLRALDRGLDIIVGCPGRLEDLMNRRELDLSGVRIAVLDEADRMADMGFLPVVRRILDATTEREQLLLFSATLDKTTAVLEKAYQRNPVRVDVAAPPEARGEVSHEMWVVDKASRRTVTSDLISGLPDGSPVIVFSRTKHGADRLAKQLRQDGVGAVAIHGNRTQRQRERALADFTDGKATALIATDIAARGIHVDDVALVLHYDLAGTAEDYTHRSGRTGRAGADGRVVTLVTHETKADAEKMGRSLNLPAPVPGPKASGAPRRAPQPEARPAGGGGAGGGARQGGKPKSGGGPRGRGGNRTGRHAAGSGAGGGGGQRSGGAPRGEGGGQRSGGGGGGASRSRTRPSGGARRGGGQR